MTVQNLYTQYLDGKITKQKFLYEVRRDQHLDMISSSNSFDDVVKILKNKSIISEKAHKEAKLATGKQEVDIIAKTIDMVNPYEYTRGMEFELNIMDVPANTGDLSEDSILKAQKKVLANLTKNPQYYFEKINGKGEVADEWVEATKKEIDKIGKGKKNIMREGLEESETPSTRNIVKELIAMSKNEPSKFEKLYKQAQTQADTTQDPKFKVLLNLFNKAKNSNGGMDEAVRPGYHEDGTPKSNDEMSDDEREAFYNDSDFLEEHGEEYDRVADVNADSSPLEERQRAIYEKYCEKTGIPMENLMSMVREAKAKKVEEATTAKTSDPIHNADVLKSISKVSNTTAKAELTKAFNAGKTIDV